jgi:hypothetical protein
MNKKCRFIFLFLTKFNNRDYLRFGFEIILQRGFDIEVWDCSSLISPEYSKSYDVPDPCEFVGIKEFKTLEEIQQVVSEITEKDIIFDDFKILKRFKYENINGARIVSTNCGTIPIPNTKGVKKIIKRLKALYQAPRQTFSLIKENYVYKKRYNHSPDYVITGGTEIPKHIKSNVTDSSKIIRAHAFDYDRYLEVERCKGYTHFMPKESFAVFLDSNISSHPDFLLNNTIPHVSADKYYPEINKFFDHFTDQTGLKVVIALHPRTNISSNVDYFEGLDIITSKTIELVKTAEVVLAHRTTSLNFAVLYKKPIILMDSDNYTTDYRSGFEQYEFLLGAKRLNITQTQSVALNDLVVDEIKYKQFKGRFIKEEGTPDKYVWEIFCDYLTNEIHYN